MRNWPAPPGNSPSVRCAARRTRDRDTSRRRPRRSRPMYVLMWTYDVSAEREAEFVRVYAGDGDWARLFARGAGYLGTELLADLAVPRRYLTVDRWTTAAAFSTF